MKKIAPLFLLILLAGCEKDEQAPVINIISPIQNQTFAPGQTVQLKVKITDDDQIHMVHYFVTNQTTFVHVLHGDEHLDASTFDLNQTFTAEAGQSYLIQLEAEDHSGNIGKKDVSISVN
jgi:hypothetical protein